MKKILLSVLAATAVLAFVGVDSAQEPPKHAPTVQTCPADVSLWFNDETSLEYSKAQLAWTRDKVPNQTDTAKLPMTETDARRVEMLKCIQVDLAWNDHYLKTGTVDLTWHDRNKEAAAFYTEVNADRYFRFIVRHNLVQQLMREDEQGLR